MQVEESITVLVAFPFQTDLQATVKTITQDYPCLQTIEELSENHLLLILDSIIDFLDIDFVNCYGALSAKLVDRRASEHYVKQQLENLNSTIHQSKEAIEPNPDLDLEKICQKLEITREEISPPLKLDRLTSLEDEIIEEQKIRKYLLLYPESSNQFDPSEKKEYQYPVKSEFVQPNQEEDLTPVTHSKEQSPWLSVFSGIALTAVLVGSYKIASFLFNH